jgi:general secretion pathway protein C
MITRWLSPLAWALVAGSSAFWALQLFARPMAAPQDARVPTLPTVPAGDLAKVLGDPLKDTADEDTHAPADADRFELLGIVAQPTRQATHAGLALLRVDNGIARTWHTGEMVTDTWQLNAIQTRGVRLRQRDSGEVLDITLPEPTLDPSMATGANTGRRAAPRVGNPAPPVGANGRPNLPSRSRPDTSRDDDDNTEEP